MAADHSGVPVLQKGTAVLQPTAHHRADPALTMLHRLARAAARAPDAAALDVELAAALREALGADRVHLLDVAQDGTVADGRLDGGEEYRVALDGGPAGIAPVVATGRPHAITDARGSDELLAEEVERFGAGAALFVPLTWGGELRRVALVAWDAAREIAPDDVDRGELLADQAAAGFARLEADARRAAGSLHDRAVVRAAAALNASLDLQTVLHTLAREAALAMSADLSGVYLGDAQRGAVATAGHGVPDSWQGLHVAPGEGACGRALASGRPFVTSDYQGDGAVTSDLERGCRSAVAVPMRWDDELRGALSVAWTTRRRIHDEDVRTLEAIAGLAALACRNAQAYEQVQHAARTDALTGLLNHGAMQVRIREEIARAERDGAALACVIVDLDDFKRVNDTRGHQAGDELLREIAASLQRGLRPYDQVARYGGDEFVLLLPGSDERDAEAVAERTRQAVRGGCSVGVAAWRPGLDADGLLEQADRALLLAKRTGKGRVAVANAAVERELDMLESQLGSPAAVQALAAAIEDRDHYTREHSERLVHLARGVAMLIGLQADQVERIASAALVHDVGKLAVPIEILEKAGPLTDDEWEAIAEHPVAGERILLRTRELAPIAPIVRHEHEHWDGNGYPDRLHGHQIPLGARIVHACQAYQAMTSPRPYRPALGHDEAVRRLRAGAGAQFDPEIVDALLDVLGSTTLSPSGRR